MCAVQSANKRTDGSLEDEVAHSKFLKILLNKFQLKIKA